MLAAALLAFMVALFALAAQLRLFIGGGAVGGEVALGDRAERLQMLGNAIDVEPFGKETWGLGALSGANDC